ncbi:MAG: GEVED domain-containing protein, partial [Methanothrix sp.]
MSSEEGARHVVSDEVHLGTLVDEDTDGLPSLLADGDDLNYSESPSGIIVESNDEDGVTFLDPLIPGRSAHATVTVNGTGYLNAWIDFDINGVWETSDQIAANDVLNTGPNAITINVPSWAPINNYTYARFRFSSDPDLQPTGGATDGEVEDYRVYLGLYNTNLTLTKTADRPTAHRGEEITYTIDLSNHGESGSFTNVTLWDILPKRVELVSVSPSPSSSSSTNLTWDVGTLGHGQYFGATIVVRVPIVDINYDMAQDVQGVGFVNVHNDYDTHQGPESVTNCAY